MAKKQLLSFHGKQEIKDAKIVALEKHKELDNLMQRTYFNHTEKKGCAVTCTMFSPAEFASGEIVTSNIHQRYETEIGIPRIIARLEDRIFEGLPVAQSKDWPLNFIQAITGIGVIKYIKSSFTVDQIDNLRKKIKLQLQYDGYNNVSAQINSFLDIDIDATR